tara:strand:- start:1089 stop:1448 length:360 start_codon:yes stop_codon:yes gene_type:complete
MQFTNTYKNRRGKTGNMIVKLNSAIHAITPHISDATNGIVNKMGIVSVVTAGTNSIVTTAIQTQDPTWLTISNVVALVSIAGSAMFMVKLGLDMYFGHRKDQREQVEHNRRMNDDNSET